MPPKVELAGNRLYFERYFVYFLKNLHRPRTRVSVFGCAPIPCAQVMARSTPNLLFNTPPPGFAFGDGRVHPGSAFLPTTFILLERGPQLRVCTFGVCTAQRPVAASDVVNSGPAVDYPAAMPSNSTATMTAPSCTDPSYCGRQQPRLAGRRPRHRRARAGVG